MKKITTLLLTMCVFPLFASINSQLNAAVRHLNKSANVAMVVTTLSGKTVYSYHPGHILTPASNMKLYTAESALLFLKPQYQFETRLFVTSKIVKHHILQGDVYLDFSGDPTLTISKINTLFEALKQMGVEKINGNFYYDRLAYDQNDTAPGWNKGDLQYCFSAPINAAIINRNCMPYVISPGRRHGHRLRPRSANMKFSFLHFNNQGITALNRRTCPILRTSVASNNTINVNGCMLVNSHSIYLSNAIKTAKGFSVAVINNLLKKNDIRLTGSILPKQIDDSLQLVAYTNSKPLYQLIKTMLKRSDNIYAGTIFKKLGQRYSHESGSWLNASKAIKGILKDSESVDLDDAVLIDGSGLSHYNQSSPLQFAEMLQAAYRDKATSHFLMEALPIGGVDGTLKYRMRSHFMRGRVHAKTGSLKGVSSLSGYVRTQHQGTLVFSIIINGFTGSIRPYRTWQDKVLSIIASH